VQSAGELTSAPKVAAVLDRLGFSFVVPLATRLEEPPAHVLGFGSRDRNPGRLDQRYSVAIS
jgi:hypothetical protein